MKPAWISLLLTALLLGTFHLAAAQEPTPQGPIYIIQAGDNLNSIAYRFGVPVDELAAANGITNYNLINIGDQLVIPGLEGITGVLTTEPVPFGETLRSLSLRYGVPVDVLERLNHITSPAELYVDYPLVIPQTEDTPPPGDRLSLAAGQSLLELAILQGSDPWSLANTNSLSSPLLVLPGQILRGSSGEDMGPGAFPSAIRDIEVSPLGQGETTVIRISGSPGISAGGTLIGHELTFFSLPDGDYTALQGVYALTATGLYPLTIQGTTAQGIPFGFTQLVRVEALDYAREALTVDPETIDPENTRPEDALWNSLAAPITPDKLWEGLFSIPVDPVFAECYPSRYGNRRSYNGSDYNYFHTGLDFCGGVGDAIYAPAAGVVVYAGKLTVRGNATMIDHGWGVYTGYMHQSEILVQVGDVVEPGQLIGRVGATGRVTGPHLHFEVWVGGVQVQPFTWLTQVFP